MESRFFSRDRAETETGGPETETPRSRDRDRGVPRPSRDIYKMSRDRAETFKNLSRDCLEPRHLSRGLHHC